MITTFIFVATGLCGILAVICLYQFAFNDHGPLDISAARYARSNTELVDSGDHGQKRLSLLAICTLVLVMGADSVFTGIILTTNLFANFLTPRGAIVAALVWSAGCTYLLYKLVFAAAREAVINDRRVAIRNLAQGDTTAQAKAAAMKARVGSALGHDYSLDANRMGARIALAATVGVLVLSTFFMRAAAPGAEAGPSGTATPPTNTPAPMQVPTPAPVRHDTVRV